MPTETGKHKKHRLHQRNRNREQYDLKALISVIPKLAKFVKTNKYGNDSIDFSDPLAVKLLNKAILKYYYRIKFWEFPDENLCPPVPGRADYIHYIADLLSDKYHGIPKGDQITCYDIGVGASCIYPIIGVVEYDWKFIGSDINSRSIRSATHIINSNSSLKNKVSLKLQENNKNLFYGIIGKKDKIDVSVCNPPFHSSQEEAIQGNLRKVTNLSGKNVKSTKLNFSGINMELVTEGGEFKFIKNMIKESKKFAENFYWFTTLVSKQSNLKGLYKYLEKTEVVKTKTILMGTGNKTSRILAWTFLTEEEQMEWRQSRWKKETK